MSNQLTQGAVQDIMNGNQVDNPIFQVLGHKKISGSGGAGADRYRLLLSDGVHSYSSAMLATQLNDLVTSNELDTLAIIRLNKYLCNTIPPDRKVMILLEVDVITKGSVAGSKIGNPQPFKAGANNNSANAGANSGYHSNVASASKPRTGSENVQPMGGRNQQPNAMPQAPKTPVGKGTAGGPPPTPGGTPARVFPIASLTPYQNKWTIRVRITSKSAIRTWSNSRGEGKLFSMNFLDESGEIKATAFTQQVEKYYEMIEINKVYYVSKATLKAADKRYNTLDNDYEMTFNNDTTVFPCEEDVDLPTVNFNFIPINQLEQHQANTAVDVIGVVKTTEPVSKVTSKSTSREITKRDLCIVDQNKVQIKMTLWGTEAESFNGDSHPILAVKGARLSDWGGRSLSVSNNSQMIVNPDIAEAHQLRGWFDSVGHSMDYEEYRSEGSAGGSTGGHSTNWKTLSQIKTENLGQSEKGDYFTTKATIIFLKKENCMYMACPSQECNKKVIDQSNGMYRCEKCQKEYPNYKWRMILSANLADYSDNQWVTNFQESAELILDKAANDLGATRDKNEAEFDQIFQDATFKSYIFKMKAKVETYNDESRVKCVVVKADPVDPVTYNKKLLDDIENMLKST